MAQRGTEDTTDTTNALTLVQKTFKILNTFSHNTHDFTAL